MSNGFLQRLVKFALGQDEAVNGLAGGKPRETISGTVGRAVLAGEWWAPAVAYLIDGILGEGHCARQAAREQRRRDAEMGFEE